MEDKTSLPTNPPPAARTAQALRELHDRAQSALTAQRERMGQLESQLTQQLDSIAETLADQCAPHGSQSEQAQQSTADVDHLRAELEQTLKAFANERDKWQAEREQLFAANAEQMRQLDERHAALDERSTNLNQQERELRERQEQMDLVAAQCAAQKSQLTANESALEKQRENVAGLEATCRSLEHNLEQQRSELAAREQTCQSSEASLQAEREALEAERASLAEQRNSLAIDSQAKDSELAARLHSVEQQLIDERTAWDQERSNFDEQRRLLAKERDDLSTALEAARRELTSAREGAAAAVERDELRQKFDFALDDMQRLRERIGELEQELASRPASAKTDSVELAQLRAERDAMAKRIAELEQAPLAPEDADAAQDRADLQRRFELAVEDVRDLKKSNAQLEAKLASLSASAGPASSSGGSSWEIMKKKMLANLEGDEDDGGGDEDRQRERATIESTIRITDEALTHKDREIAELKKQLAESAVAPPDDGEAVRQLVDADAVIAEHRARIAQIEKEMTDKLRAAEIELSVERAKLTRERAQLSEWQSQIDAHRPPGESVAAASSLPQPKRRWLSRLGLNGDEGG